MQSKQVKSVLGNTAEVTPFHMSLLRVGGVTKSYANHFLMIGDAAGQADPATGDGIHFGMEAAEIAANTIVEGFAKQDLSEKFLTKYEKRWKWKFGLDFYM